jgi:hypothetical protein
MVMNMTIIHYQSRDISTIISVHHALKETARVKKLMQEALERVLLLAEKTGSEAGLQ